MLTQTTIAPRGWLHTLDPRSKMAVCAVGIILVLTADALPLLLALCVATLLLLSSHISPRRIRAIGLSLAPLITIVLITWPLFYSRGDDVWLAWLFMRITRDGVLGGITTTLRILALVYVVALLATTTNQADLIRALVKLRLPYALGLTIALSLRYIPTLYLLYETVTDAQRARGWDMPKSNLLTRAQGYLPVLIAVLIGALRLSDQTAMALHARGFDANRPRIYYREIQFGRMDWWLTLTSFAIAALLIAYRLLV
jgi:energy-coupling factor transport system permease protein